MRKSFSVAYLLLLLSGVWSGCTAAGQDVSTTASDGLHQYRAVCLEKAAHGGNDQVLSRWLDDKEKAVALGRYHGDFKGKGHNWIIEERVKPAAAKPTS
jgi:hypothetical protein